MKAAYTFAAMALALGGQATQPQCSLSRPNVVLIMSDDQDRRLNSLDYMQSVQKHLVAGGTQFTNHYATVSNCCPSRATLLRGQAAHNTNVTHVRPPGGNYDKWLMSGEDHDYLPHWIRRAGYRAEYVGKFLNGLNTVNWVQPPRGWDHIDTLLDPYTGNYNNPVMSMNGERPVSYHGFHQTDVIRTKALDRLDKLTGSGKPYYLTIAPYAPHVQGQDPPVPCSRHNRTFEGVRVPRFANWNPPDEIQSQKSVWMRSLAPLNSTQEEYADFHHRRRLQSLQGVDEIVEDVIAMLETKKQLQDTYVIYTTDNGYHIGAHRLPGGKALPYIMDTNLPFVVRGPGVPSNVTSNLASAHLDLAPTFLDIMGLNSEEWPPFLDGRSLLSEWHEPLPQTEPSAGDGKEIINIEFWGDKIIEAPYPTVDLSNTSYKTLRIVTERQQWMFAKWCTNEMELYNTSADPWEIDNLARGVIKPEIQRVIDRLNAILLVTKSCVGDSCRNPWSALQPPGWHLDKPLNSLASALNERYDDFFASLPIVQFRECMQYQDEENEHPFYPPGAEHGLGKAYRHPTDNFFTTTPNGTAVPQNEAPQGGLDQRHVTLEEIIRLSRELTDEELGFGEVAGDEHGGGPPIVD